jgi:signal-transduction protein with cAMP-binding, CBS, and nucleotidyltransferase domain
MYSFLTQTPARYTIDALEDSALFCLEKNMLEELYVKVPGFEKFFRHLLQNAFIAGQQRIIEAMRLTADERYCKFIEHYPLMEKNCR